MATGIFILFMIVFTGIGFVAGVGWRMRREAKEDVEYQAWQERERKLDRPRPSPAGRPGYRGT